MSNVFFIPELDDDIAEKSLHDDLVALGFTFKAPNLGGIPDIDLVNILYLSVGVLAKDVASGIATDVVKSAIAKTASWVRSKRRRQPDSRDYAAEIHMYHAETGEYLGRAQVAFPADGTPRIVSGNRSEPGPEQRRS